jgi:putative ABC transport system permease protein
MFQLRESHVYNHALRCVFFNIFEISHRKIKMLLNAIRSAFFALLKDRKYTIVAVVLLPVGITLSTLAFSVFDGSVRKTVPFDRPTQLILVGKGNPLHSDEFFNLSEIDFETIKNQCKSYESIGCEIASSGAVSHGHEQPTIAAISKVSPGYFEVLRTASKLGRSFAESDFGPNLHAVVIISYQTWIRHFQGDLSAVGKYLEINGITYTVIGVLDEAIRRPATGASLWIPHRMSDTLASPHTPDKRVIARLRNGISLENARQEIRRLVPDMGRAVRQASPDQFNLVALLEQLVGRTKYVLTFCLLVCISTLLVACLNVGNLMLLRLMRRKHDLGIKLALGSSAALLRTEVLI